MYTEYEKIKEYFDILNKDTSHFSSSNDICTPMDCVKEMVDAIPQELWERESLKILDPCAGNGNFPAYLVTKTNLKNIQMNELNQARIKNILKYFGTEAHITIRDFLQFPSTEKYDLIIANPPFAQFMDNGKRAAKNHSLSRQFLEKAYDIVADNGYIVFILPDNWMSYADRNDLPNKLSKYQFIEMDLGKCKSYFPGVGSSFTWFVWRKSIGNNETIIHNGYKINDTQKVILPKNANYIPLYCHPIVQSIFNKVVNSTNEKYNVQTSSNLHKYTKAHLLNNMRTDKYCYEIVHTPSQTVWSERPHIYQNGWKTYLPTTTYFIPFIKENCGMTQSIAFILNNSEKEAIQTCSELKNNIYSLVISLTRYGNFNNQRILQNLTKYELLELTQEEQDFLISMKGKLYE